MDRRLVAGGSGALCLSVFTVLATLLRPRFRDVQDPMKRAGMFNGFMSNIARQP
jgi:hypothetical protein